MDDWWCRLTQFSLTTADTSPPSRLRPEQQCLGRFYYFVSVYLPCPQTEQNPLHYFYTLVSLHVPARVYYECGNETSKRASALHTERKSDGKDPTYENFPAPGIRSFSGGADFRRPFAGYSGRTYADVCHQNR